MNETHESPDSPRGPVSVSQETAAGRESPGSAAGSARPASLHQIIWLRGVLRIIAEQIREPGPDQPVEECYRFARDLARAALNQQEEQGNLCVGDLCIDPEQVEESAVAFQNGDYQSAEEILRELPRGSE